MKQAKKQGFDLRTHVRDGKGNIVKVNPYRLHVVNGNREFERPPGSGWFYTEGGDLIRKPKGQAAPPSYVKQAPELSEEELEAQILMLQSKLKKAKPAEQAEQVEELPEVHVTLESLDAETVVNPNPTTSYPEARKPGSLFRR